MFCKRHHIVSGALALIVASATSVCIAAEPKSGVAFNGASFAEAKADEAFGFETLSVAAWVKLNRTDGSQIFVNRGGAPQLFTLYLYDSRIRMLVENEKGRYAHANVPAPSAEKWTHYLGTYDGDAIRLYVDGELAAKTNAPGTLRSGSAPLDIGALQSDSRFLDGELDEVRIWNRALTAAEAAQVAGGDDAGSLQEGQIARWRSDGFDGEVWQNAVAQAPSATYRAFKPGIASRKDDGYRGIWFTLGQFSEHGDKYSGGLGTYTAKHVPLAVYSPEADKTFFVYGAGRRGERYLLAMASYYDHKTGEVPRPTVVHDKQGVNDPHDNPSIALDESGRVWAFISGRGRRRPGFIYRSVEPYSTDAFERVYEGEFTYPQPWPVKDKGFLFLFTRYTRGRELYFATGKDGSDWTDAVKIAGMGGHYQTSNAFGDRVVTAFNMHPSGVDTRTNLYYVETRDMGRTWTTVDGRKLELPLEDKHCPALVHDYEADGRLVYVKDIQLDADGNPVVLIVTSALHQPGPGGEPRFFTTVVWDGEQWQFRNVTGTSHNYDMGSLYIEDGDVWRVVAPTEPGPQRWGTGGEIAVWQSKDKGRNWTKERNVTADSEMNHMYVRRPVNAHPDFYGFWADGNPDELSPSRLYFTNKAGDKVWRLPYDMEGEFAKPELVVGE